MDNSAYIVLITSFDPERRIGGIKRIREVTGCGLAEAKLLIENYPSEVMNGMYLTQAEELSGLLKETGMTVEIQIDEANIPIIKNLDQIYFEPIEDHHEPGYFIENKNINYKELLEFALEKADSFSLVWRDYEFYDSAFELEDKLRPWLISEYSSSSWPGTITFGREALVKKYEVNKKTIRLLRCVTSVFDFIAPNYPEDLALYKDNKVIFSSVTHEEIATYET
jgi:hypothetical protein